MKALACEALGTFQFKSYQTSVYPPRAHLQLLGLGVLGVAESPVDAVVVFDAALGGVGGHGERLPHHRQPSDGLHHQVLQVVVRDLLQEGGDGRRIGTRGWGKRGKHKTGFQFVVFVIDTVVWRTIILRLLISD